MAIATEPHPDPLRARVPADGEQLAVGRVVGRLVGGDSAVAVRAGDDDLGEALTGRGAAALVVEDPRGGGVVVVGGEPGEQRDRVLVGADRRQVARQRDDELGVGQPLAVSVWNC